MLTKKKIKYLLDNEFIIPDVAICYYGTKQVIKHYCSLCNKLFIPKVIMIFYVVFVYIKNTKFSKKLKLNMTLSNIKTLLILFMWNKIYFKNKK